MDLDQMRFQLSRRSCLQVGLGGFLAGGSAARAAGATAVRSVAAVVTVYSHNSHADVILTKLMAGWEHKGGPGPALRLAAVYIDQPEGSKPGLELCQQHDVPVFSTIEQAVTVGGNSIPVDGVLSVGEHGMYPHNEIGQHLYPRRRFMDEILDTFEKYDRVVPVFNDKHLGPVWSDAIWMYERCRRLNVPLMAGSSMPVGYWTNDLDLPLGSEIEGAVGIAYGGLEAYGFHALELFQSLVERRVGAEQGVRAVRFLEGAALWEAVDNGVISRPALEAAFAAVPKTDKADMRQDPNAGLFLFEYVDGMTGAVLYLGCARGTSVGLKLRGQAAPIATVFDSRTEPRFPHFAFLLKAIEKMVYSGRPTYPVERTLLTSGILDRALNSRALHGKRLETPELRIAYRPVEYPWAAHVDLQQPPVGG